MHRHGQKLTAAVITGRGLDLSTANHEWGRAQEPLCFLLLLTTDNSRNGKSSSVFAYLLVSPQTHGHKDGPWLNSVGYKTVQKVINKGKRLVGKKGD